MAFYMYAMSNPANIRKAKDAIKQEFERMLKDGVTAKELKEAKAGYLKTRKTSRSDDGALAAMLQNNIVTRRTMDFHAKYEAKIKNVTIDQVRAAMNKHLKWKNLNIVVAGDLNRKTPQAKKAAAPPVKPGK